MSKRAILAATAMVAVSFNPIFTASAWAAVTLLDPVPAAEGPSPTTLAAMETQCDNIATGKGPNWNGELDESSIQETLVSGPTYVGTHTIDDAIPGTLEGAGTFTPASIEYGNPYRNGGSVNMWADGTALGGHYSASEYDFEGEFETTYSFAFNCTMTETVQVPLQGYYEVAGDFGESEDAIRANCEAYTAMGSHETRPPWWGQDHGGSPSDPHCRFVMTDEGGPDEQERPDEAGTPIEETQTDTLLAHEDAGEGFFDSEPADIGKVLVCISPTTSTQTKKGAPGTWVAKHGYVGSSVEGEPGCNTTWYNTGAKAGVTNLNDGSNNVVTIPVILP